MADDNETLTPEQSELGKKAHYDSQYNPEKLFPIPRQSKRDELGIKDKPPFFGIDIWNHYEVSWLNEKGKPVVAIAEIVYDCESPNIIESKSMKLYFNSFNNTKCRTADNACAMMERDLSARVGVPVKVQLKLLSEIKNEKLSVRLNGTSIDDLDIECKEYKVNPKLLKASGKVVEETLCTDLLKSNCLVTHQPDWCSIQITYKGKKIDREGLLKYIVSFRNDNEFHEQCIEKIFMHIMKHCKPEKLTVYGRSTRRGGLDINSYRSTEEIECKVENIRLCRQ
ncbi:MAG TPA: NADPH-dependent 7-cyano-7-deazaguanine reductase QueF [Gammaproteobacteria bacterium]|jgi:7-cyano-7-deazaguanine reductase|nr:NADPH-dependent 7-cyano-7-deazaguanine reductase QueF [Gammaproteobacteria bacterium]